MLLKIFHYCLKNWLHFFLHFVLKMLSSKSWLLFAVHCCWRFLKFFNIRKFVGFVVFQVAFIQSLNLWTWNFKTTPVSIFYTKEHHSDITWNMQENISGLQLQITKLKTVSTVNVWTGPSNNGICWYL